MSNYQFEGIVGSNQQALVVFDIGPTYISAYNSPPGAVITGLSSVTIPNTGTVTSNVWNVIYPSPDLYGLNLDLSHDTMANIQELVVIDGGVELTRAEYDELQTITGSNNTVELTDGGTYSLNDRNRHELPRWQ